MGHAQQDQEALANSGNHPAIHLDRSAGYALHKGAHLSVAPIAW
jgi:hypothetical protein